MALPSVGKVNCLETVPLLALDLDPPDAKSNHQLDTRTPKMGGREDSPNSGSASPEADLKAFPEAAVTDPSFFKRTKGRAFDNDSLESFYKPIDSYEGRHRYDPSFEWTPKEEKRVVRKVSSSALGEQILRHSLLMTLSDRLEDMHLGVPDVLRATTRQREHLTSPFRQYA